jgi:hypothetical protein
MSNQCQKCNNYKWGDGLGGDVLQSASFRRKSHMNEEQMFWVARSLAAAILAVKWCVAAMQFGHDNMQRSVP